MKDKLSPADKLAALDALKERVLAATQDSPLGDEAAERLGRRIGYWQQSLQREAEPVEEDAHRENRERRQAAYAKLRLMTQEDAVGEVIDDLDIVAYFEDNSFDHAFGTKRQYDLVAEGGGEGVEVEWRDCEVEGLVEEFVVSHSVSVTSPRAKHEDDTQAVQVSAFFQLRTLSVEHGGIETVDLKDGKEPLRFPVWSFKATYNVDVEA